MGDGWLLFIALLAWMGEPLSFRFVVQPLVAIVLGLRDGRLDHRAGKRPYFLSLFEEKLDRRTRLREGMRAVALPFAVAVVIDGLVQWMVARQVRVWHAVVIGILLIAVPYIAARGLGNRLFGAAGKRHA